VTISEPPHAVLYDFDFTLADSSPGVVDCVNCALRQLGLSAAPPDLIRQTIGLSMSATLAHLTGSCPGVKKAGEAWLTSGDHGLCRALSAIY
jgi:phosphoglycolate phosphatase-like HAD superfamily hydrolase